MKIRAISEQRCGLGEGPLWDNDAQALYWVDSFGPTLLRYDFNRHTTETWTLPGNRVGSIASREQGGLILAMDQGFYQYVPESGYCEVIAQPLAGYHGLRFNDGKVDPFGAFVAGAMNIDSTKTENCPMWRLSPNLDIVKILDGFICFNGPCFDAGGERLYVTGRELDLIEAFDYGPTQLPTNGRRFLADCNPDGATVDNEGFVWSAQWDQECLLRIDPAGHIDRRLSIPGQIVSSVMFGGPDLEHIFVTTVAANVNGAQSFDVDAGRVFVIEDSGYRGCPEPRFNG